MSSASNTTQSGAVSHPNIYQLPIIGASTADIASKNSVYGLKAGQSDYLGLFVYIPTTTTQLNLAGTANGAATGASFTVAFTAIQPTGVTTASGASGSVNGR